MARTKFRTITRCVSAIGPRQAGLCVSEGSPDSANSTAQCAGSARLSSACGGDDMRGCRPPRLHKDQAGSVLEVWQSPASATLAASSPSQTDVSPLGATSRPTTTSWWRPASSSRHPTKGSEHQKVPHSEAASSQPNVPAQSGHSSPGASKTVSPTTLSCSAIDASSTRSDSLALE